MANKINKEIVKNPLFQMVDSSATYQQLSDYARQELKAIQEVAPKTKDRCTISNSDDGLILKALTLECSSIAQRSVILYRGSYFPEDQCYSQSDKQIPFSLSFGTGLFAGYLYESGTKGAMAFDYMKKSVNHAYAIAVSVDDFHTSPFFIPSTNAICQFAGKEEIFHARSKSFKESDVKDLKGFPSFKSVTRRDHLISNLSRVTFLEKFKLYKQQAIFLK